MEELTSDGLKLPSSIITEGHNKRFAGFRVVAESTDILPFVGRGCQILLRPLGYPPPGYNEIAVIYLATNISGTS